MADAQSDAELVASAAAGDDSAFRNLVDRHGAAISTLCRSLVRNPSDAEEMAQEAIFRAYLSLGELRNGGAFGPWLRRITFRTCVDFLRRLQPELFTLGSELNLACATNGPYEMLERQEVNREVRIAVSQLPNKYRLPVMLRDLEGMSYQEVSNVLGVPIGTAKSHVFMGRKQLHELLKSFMYEETLMPESQPIVAGGLYPNFTDRARLAIVLAKEAAVGRGAEVGVTELLIGLVELHDREAELLRQRNIPKAIGGIPGGLGGTLLRRQGITADLIRADRLATDGSDALAIVLQKATRFSGQVRNSYVGTEHLLLGIVSQYTDWAILRQHGITETLIRREISHASG